MKISFVLSQANLTGGVRVVQIYGERLARRGHEVVVISAPPPAPSLRQRLRSLASGRGWPGAPAREPSHLDDSALEHRVLERFRPVRDEDVPDADVVVATFWRTAAPVARLSPRKGAKAYFMQDYGAPGMEIEDLVPTWKLGLHLITIAQWLVDLIHEHCGPVPVSLVLNSVDTNLFHAPPRGRQPVPTLGFNYREIPVKGADIVLEAFRLARRELPQLRLLTFGPLAPTRALPDGVEFSLRPSDAQVREIYARCDAWLFASRREGFGLPILEAMACRTPVIATPAGAAPELVARGGGVLVAPEDPADMARAIVRLCSTSQVEWRALSDHAHATVRGYSWDDATDRFEVALHAAIGR
jgi:glycosyltransferase involved in cell wall biosynthesis